MKVILKQAVPKLGKEGQLVNVKDGYARNFLFPQKMAIVADKKQLEVLGRQQAKIEAELEKTKASAETVGEKINGKLIKIETKAGGDGRLFGAVTSQDICDAIKSQLKQDVDKKAVLLLRPIKRLGNYDIEINIHRNVNIELKLNVFDPEFVVLDEVMPELEAELAADAEAAAAQTAAAEEANPVAKAEDETDDEE
ncbi:MAG: 50S ribosomal protein L9 [Fimbriimonadaceae bacterium]